MAHIFNEQKSKFETMELQPIPTLDQYSENNIKQDFTFSNKYDNIADIENLKDYNNYGIDTKPLENINLIDLQNNSSKPGEEFIDISNINFDNNNLVDFSQNNKEKSKKSNSKEIKNNDNGNLDNKIKFENIQTSSTFDAGKILVNNETKNKILKNKGNNSDYNNDEIDKVLKYIDKKILNKDFDQADNYLKYEEFPYSTEIEKIENQNKNTGLYNHNELNEATNNDYLSSTDNQNNKNIDLYTSKEEFDDNYLTTTDNLNIDSNFSNETFKENDLLKKDNQNTQIETNKSNYLSSVDNQIIDSYITQDKIDNNKNIESNILNDITNYNYLSSTDNQNNQNIDSYLTNDIINNNYSIDNEKIDIKDQFDINEIINDNNLSSENNINEYQPEYSLNQSNKKGANYDGSKITNVKLPPLHLEDEIEHNKIKNIIIPYKKEIIVPVQKKIEVPIQKKIKAPIPKVTTILTPKTEGIFQDTSSYVEPSPSLIRYTSPSNNNEFQNQLTFPEYNLTSENIKAPIIDSTSTVQVSSTINYIPEKFNISTKETYENYSNPFNYKIDSIPQKSTVKYNARSPVIGSKTKYNVSTNSIINIPVKYNISTYPLESSIINSPKTSPNKYNTSTTKVRIFPLKYNVISQSNVPKLKYSKSLMDIPIKYNSNSIPLQSSIYSSLNKYNYSSMKLNESHSYNDLSNPLPLHSKLYNVPRQKKSKVNYIIKTNSLNPSNKYDKNSNEINSKNNLHSYKSSPQIFYNNNSSSFKYNSPVEYDNYNITNNPIVNSLQYNNSYNDSIYKSFYPIDRSLSPGIEVSRVFSPLNNGMEKDSSRNMYRPKRFRNKPKRNKKIIYIKKSLVK